MQLQINETESIRKECERLLTAFCDRFPNEEFQNEAYTWLQKLFVHCDSFSGQPAGWAGGVVYVVKEWTTCKCPEVLNADMEEIFGMSMDVIRKRAYQVWEILEAGGEMDYPTHAFRPGTRAWALSQLISYLKAYVAEGLDDAREDRLARNAGFRPAPNSAHSLI